MFTQIYMAAYKISMKMCFKNIFDTGISFFGQLNIFFNIPQGINNGNFAFTFNIISCFTQAAGI